MREKILEVLWKYGEAVPDICGEEEYGFDIHICGERADQFFEDLEALLTS